MTPQMREYCEREWREVLERTGVETVRLKMSHREFAGPARTAAVEFVRAKPPGEEFFQYANREFVEGWLRDKDEHAACIANRRHDELKELTERGNAWAIAGTVAAIISAAAAIVAVALAL